MLAAQKAGKEKKPGGFRRRPHGWLQALTFALAFILIFSPSSAAWTADATPWTPPSTNWDMLFRCIAYEPKQWDVVVPYKDFGDVETPIVKRVIAGRPDGGNRL